ncbi:MAG: L-cysteine:1D-myo-inositol 2-amino-2-deoxy-alpha-D-glucopyranoside ligase, partial [Pseudonocardiales bacterium]|nr:L-cysteine:1D-myo-inositol 2-amino-2-deoxy-alpha-D-glucopyranoside ligase [Pseudonocardiales bacterium]
MASLPAARSLTLGGQALPLISPARVYLCGITPYDVTHLGHAATFVWADVATSIMRLAGVEVVVCRNVTDIDDVLTLAAAVRDSPYDEFAVTQEYLFEQDMAALRVRRPTYAPRARRYVDRVIQLAAALIESGHGYHRDGQVYFRGYPAIPGGPPALADEHGELTGGPSRGEPYDVAVWRSSGLGDPAWPSPWGPGRPGWHAECAAIAVSVLGASVDLVAGGADLAFPHHAYQAALVEAATGVRPFARARLSVGTVRIGGEKMAKSTGNLVLVGDLLRDHSPAAIRLLLLDRNWHDAWDFRPEDLVTSAGRLERLYSA